MTEIGFVMGLFSGMQAICTLYGALMLIVGVLVGILAGAMPGLSPAMAVALLVPFTYGLDPVLSFILFIATYQAANYGGSITAITVNAPGTPSAVVTALDGYQLTRKGKVSEALGVAVSASALGGVAGALILIVCAIPVAKLALSFGPPEYFSLGIAGLGSVVVFGRSGKLKAFAAVLLGLLLNSVGMDPFTGETRLTFGVFELFDGFSFIPAMIGLFAVAEVLQQYENAPEARDNEKSGKTFDQKMFLSGILFRKILKPIAGSSIVGTFIGIIPGAGATIASFVSYACARRMSSEAHLFGSGSIEGIAASEAANSSSVGGALVPLLSLGIPGSATDAVLLGALSLHGIVVGPQLYTTNPDLVYAVFASVLFANVLIFIFGSFGNVLWVKVIDIPRGIQLPCILLMAMLGSYSVKNSLWDSWVCLGFGVLGWLLKKYSYPPAAVVLGLVLGGMVEMNFRRSLLMGNWTLFFTRPISIAFILVTCISIALSLRTPPTFTKEHEN